MFGLAQVQAQVQGQAEMENDPGERVFVVTEEVEVSGSYWCTPSLTEI
jgi:hypothetical protein